MPPPIQMIHVNRVINAARIPLPQTTIGGGILGYVAGEMILKDKGLARYIDPSMAGIHLIPLLPAVVVFVFGWWLHAQDGRKKVPGNA